MLINIHHDLTGDWEQDEPTVREIAEKPTSAAKFLVHAQVVETLFNMLTHGTRFAPKFPQRAGLLKKVHDELYPIGHFARLHFAASETVMISWRDGNQNFDATLEVRREDFVRLDEDTVATFVLGREGIDWFSIDKGDFYIVLNSIPDLGQLTVVLSLISNFMLFNKSLIISF